MAQVDVSASPVVGSVGIAWSTKGGACDGSEGTGMGAQQLMEYPDGAESASGWQYAESEWLKSAPDEHEELSSAE